MTAPAETRVTAELCPADVALPDGRVLEGVLVSLTDEAVSVWQGSPPDSDPRMTAVLVWHGPRDRECTIPERGTFTMFTPDGFLIVNHQGGGPR